MKKTFFILLCAVCVCSCTKDDDPEEEPIGKLEIKIDSEEIKEHVTINFGMGYNITPMTRAAISSVASAILPR